MRKVLFIISSDPRTSARPAEAIRIAAGVSAWGRATVKVCLVGPAALILCDGKEPMKDEHHFATCLPILPEPIYVLNAFQQEIGTSRAQAIDVTKLAQLARHHDTVVRF